MAPTAYVKNTSTFPNNNTNSTLPSYEYTPVSMTTKTVLLVLLLICGAFGLVSNSTILHFERQKRSKASSSDPQSRDRSLTLYFMKSLALTDLLCSLVNVPLTSMFMFVDMFQTDLDCKVFHMPLFGLPCITITNLTVIAVERYLAIFHPFWAPSRAFAKNMVVAAWVIGGSLGVILTIPIKNTLVHIDNDTYTLTCLAGQDKAWEKAVFSIIMFLVYFVPNIVMLFTAFTITMFLRKRKRQINSANPPYIDRSQAWRFKDSKMFMNIIFVFAVPYALFFVYGTVKKLANANILSFEPDYIVRICTALLGFSNSALNPIVYYISSSYFRKELKKVLKM